MSQSTSIEWTHWPGRVGVSWNPTRGCTRVSEGCRNCYAERIAARFSGKDYENQHNPFAGFAEMTPSGSRWTGRVELIPKKLEEPLRWKEPCAVFVDSMSDLFHEKLSAKDIISVFEVMAACQQHVFIVLTKRPERIEPVLFGAEGRWYLGGGDYYPHIILGTSVEDQATADLRISVLLNSGWLGPTMVSAEPLLGPVTLEASQGLSWVVAGGESGPGARPAHPDWFRTVRDECQAAGVPFFFKQWGEWAPHTIGSTRNTFRHDFAPHTPTNTLSSVFRVGKTRAGRLLDGREWSEFPRLT